MGTEWSAVGETGCGSRLLVKRLTRGCPVPRPGQHLAVPADHKPLIVGTVRWSLEDAIASPAEHLHTGCLAVRYVQRVTIRHGVFHMLNAIGTDRFVIDRDATARNPSHGDPRLARTAFGPLDTATVEPDRQARQRSHQVITPNGAHGISGLVDIPPGIRPPGKGIIARPAR